MNGKHPNGFRVYLETQSIWKPKGIEIGAYEIKYDN